VFLPSLSIVVVTYRRERVLIDTIEALLRLDCDDKEIIVIDQSPFHGSEIEARMVELVAVGGVRHIRVDTPNIPAAMNLGLRLAKARAVMFVDDDIRPSPDLARAHLAAQRSGRATLIAGRVIQPWQQTGASAGAGLLLRTTKYRRARDAAPRSASDGVERSAIRCKARKAGRVSLVEANDIAAFESLLPERLRRRLGLIRRIVPHNDSSHDSPDADHSCIAESCDICFSNAFMGGNFSVDRAIALQIGGFDENFQRAAYRFEAEFAYRLIKAGHRIGYAPHALLYHLKCPDGGTRAFSDHLRTARPDHAVGEYYCLLRTWRGWPSLRAIAGRPFKAIATRHHLRSPWWIPVTLIGEIRAAAWAISLALRGPKLAPPC
jgi:GT2 family glycosyltransferase